MGDDLATFEGRLAAVGQLRDEEPRIEAARERRRRDPARERDEPVGREAL